ncbi:MAG: hypothetical protein EP329_26455 [Deltaproteobacteria bacterium]|nr:MAG: hypothetical protein EP329_26455 [Deltaproteobacteria bacterium]
MKRRLIALVLLTATTLWGVACGGDGASGGDDVATADAADATADAADVVALDTIPPLEKISKVTFKLGGVNNTFDVNGEADYIPTDESGKLFKIAADKGLRKLEISLVPVEEYVVGHWADYEFSEVGVQICYNDGSGLAQAPGCSVGFTHGSIAYDITISENGGAGSYVQGTFSATLQDSDGNTLDLTEGVFDVKHR